MYNAAHVHFHPSTRDVSHATLQTRLPVFVNCSNTSDFFLVASVCYAVIEFNKTGSLGTRLLSKCNLAWTYRFYSINFYSSSIHAVWPRL